MTKQKSLASKRQEILETLSKGIVDLQFTKVNGDLRNMVATRAIDLLPEDKRPDSEDKREQNETIVTVFDLEVNDWRSFRIENLVEYRGRV